MSLINFPILYIPDPVKGRPLFSGQIYVGKPDLDPTVVINQKQLNVIEEDGTIVPVAQPFTLSAGGVPVYNGNPVRLDVDGNYSIKILNKLGAQTYYIENVFEGQPVTEASLPALVDTQLINDLSQAYEVADSVALVAALLPTSKVVHVTDENDHGTYDLAVGQTANGRTILALADAVHFALQRKYIESYEAFIWQADPTGSDVFGNGVNGGTQAFLTPQFALDSIATLIGHQQTIQLADGDYNTSSRPPGQDPRAAVIQFSGKVTTFRSALSGDDVSGAVVIKGNPLDNTAVKIQSSLNYTYGIYNNGGQLALQDLTINTTTVSGGILLVSHRNTAHTYCKNVIADGIFTTRLTACVATESGGQLEWIDGKIKNAPIGAFAQGNGENMTFATRADPIFEGNDTAVVAKNGAVVSLNAVKPGFSNIEIIDSSNGSGVLVATGAHVTARGAGSLEYCKVAASVELDQASMDLVFAETLDIVNLVAASIKYNASNYQRNIVADASTVELVTSNSYVSPAIANTDIRPIQLLNGSLISQEGTNNINGSAGLDRASVFPSILTYSADSQVLSPIAKRLASVIVSSSITAPRINCEIDSSLAYEGQVMRVTFNDANTNNVQLIGTGTHMRFANSILIGKGVGDYTGATFILSDGKWEIDGLGQLIV